jgi:hypothetical protein
MLRRADFHQPTQEPKLLLRAGAGRVGDQRSVGTVEKELACDQVVACRSEGYLVAGVLLGSRPPPTITSAVAVAVAIAIAVTIKSLFVVYAPEYRSNGIHAIQRKRTLSNVRPPLVNLQQNESWKIPTGSCFLDEG